MRRAVLVAVAGAASLVTTLAAGCGGDHAAEATAQATSATSQAIVGGTVDATRPDVLLLRDDTAAGFRCTATLIAPNLVITARHCVGKRGTGTTLCRGDATDNGAQSLPSYVGDVDAAPMYLSASASSPLLARGLAVYDDGSTTTCAHDVALVALDRKLGGITPAMLRRTPVAVNDSLVAMGFGWTDRNATVNASERMRGTTEVLALGPAVYSFQPLGDAAAMPQAVAVAGGEIAVRGITMTGDSGGPAFDGMGRLAALVSRGYSDATYGPGTFTTIAAHLATIDAALFATGNGRAADAGAGADAALPPSDGGGGVTAAPPARAPGADAAPADVVDGRPGDGCAVARARGVRLGDPGAAIAAVAAAFLVRARRRRRRRAFTTTRGERPPGG